MTIVGSSGHLYYNCTPCALCDNGWVATVESKIDELYQQPVASFVGARAALAKTLSGAEAARVRKLAKPTVVPWAINQVYWKARRTYERVLESGQRVRHAQIAALEGKSSDVRAAAETHRAAIADAVREAERLASADGSRPSPDALTRTFEALSLASGPPDPHGRLTKPLQPAGFEALTGVKPKAGPRADQKSSRSVRLQADGKERREKKREREEAGRARVEAAAARRRERDLKQAEAALERAETAETLARGSWERRKTDVERARAKVTHLKSAI
jgi:hypothetical protein